MGNTVSGKDGGGWGGGEDKLGQKVAESIIAFGLGAKLKNKTKYRQKIQSTSPSSGRMFDTDVTDLSLPRLRAGHFPMACQL